MKVCLIQLGSRYKWEKDEKHYCHFESVKIVLIKSAYQILTDELVIS